VFKEVETGAAFEVLAIIGILDFKSGDGKIS